MTGNDRESEDRKALWAWTWRQNSIWVQIEKNRAGWEYRQALRDFSGERIHWATHDSFLKEIIPLLNPFHLEMEL